MTKFLFQARHKFRKICESPATKQIINETHIGFKISKEIKI
jgi:hypothetical protein